MALKFDDITELLQTLNKDTAKAERPPKREFDAQKANVELKRQKLELDKAKFECQKQKDRTRHADTGGILASFGLTAAALALLVQLILAVIVFLKF